MAYSDFAPHRRSRRRRNVVILIVLAVIVGVLVLAVRYRTERRQSIDYLTAAAAMARDHADIAEQLGSLLQDLGTEERPAMDLRLETMAGKAGDAAKTLDEQIVSRPVAEVAGLMDVAASSWADGIVDIRQAINGILDAGEGDAGGDSNLRDAFELVRVGDRAYALALAATAKLDPELVPTELPQVSYTEGTYGPLYDASVVGELLRQGDLTTLVDISLVMKTIPEPVSRSGSIWSIPASDSLSLEVTVSNTGNVVAQNIKVVVTLQRVGSAEVIEPASQVIPSIDTDKSEIRVFDNIAAEPGAVYTVTATATVEGVDDPTDDNTDSLTFERNAG